MESNEGSPTTTTTSTSLWSTVELNTPENSSERYEIKDAIGASLVDETVELHAELSSLQEILSDFNNNNDQNNNANMLPEPPFLRTNLEKQISVLVELLQQKMAKSNGELGLPAMLSEEEREIIKSVSRGGSRSATNDDTSHDAGLNAGHSTTVVEPLASPRPQTPLPQTDITISEIDKLTAELRQCFHKERERLMEDISKVQTTLLCGGGAIRATEETRRPSTASIKQLQHLNNKLEKEVTQTKIHHVPKPPVAGGGKWSNNFKKLPTPPSSGSKSSSYTRSNLVVQSAAKRTANNTAIVTIGM